MKPRNFPERKRRRQVVALATITKNRKGLSDSEYGEKFKVELLSLTAAVNRGNQRGKMSKIERTQVANLIRNASKK